MHVSTSCRREEVTQWKEMNGPDKIVDFFRDSAQLLRACLCQITEIPKHIGIVRLCCWVVTVNHWFPAKQIRYLTNRLFHVMDRISNTINPRQTCLANRHNRRHGKERRQQQYQRDRDVWRHLSERRKESDGRT